MIVRKYDGSTDMWSTVLEVKISDELVQDLKCIRGIDYEEELHKLIQTEIDETLPKLIECAIEANVANVS